MKEIKSGTANIESNKSEYGHVEMPFKEINQVCYRCGVNANVLTNIKKYGKCPFKLSYDVSTYHEGVCECCEEITFITDTRDFFYPNFSLLQKNWILKLKK